MSDGGVVALVGFLYQLLGSAAAGVGADVELVELEKESQDAAVRRQGVDRGELTQFKYSSGGTSISPGDLAEILVNLDRADPEHAFDWILVTNREYSAATQQILNGERERAGSPANVTEKNIKIIAKSGDRLALRRQTLADFLDILNTAGRRFGLSDEEIRKGAATAVGAMWLQLERDGPGTPLSPADLDGWLAGFTAPLPLAGADARDRLAADVRLLAGGEDGVPVSDAVPRAGLNDLVASPAAIAVIVGPGGCGKTLSTMRALVDMMSQSGPLGAIVQPGESPSIGGHVSRWRSRAGPRPLEHDPISLARLTTAAGPGRVLVLSLDGLDEAPWRERMSEARSLVRLTRTEAGRRPTGGGPVKVVLTCRELNDLDGVLSGPGVGGANTGPPAEVIRLAEFDEKEFGRVWSMWFADLPRPPASRQGVRAADADTLTVEEATAAVNSIAERVGVALRHPTMLGCFRDLTGDERRAVLDGSGAAWRRLLDGYAGWFVKKVTRRRDIPSGEARAMLGAVARVTCGHSVPHERDAGWVEPAKAEVGCANYRARQMFDDAASCGLIDLIPTRAPLQTAGPRWRWRYDFVGDYFAIAG